MKITLERLREIITEEVIKEELAPEIAAPAIAAMLQGMEPDATSDVFGDAFNQMYGEGALDAEAERQASVEEPEPEMRQPIGFDREPEEASIKEPRGRMGFRENINEMIEEEYYTYLIQEAWQYNQWHPFKNREEWARSVLANPSAHSREDVWDAKDLEKEGFPPHRDEFQNPQSPAKPGRVLRDAPDDIAEIALAWEDFINRTSRENIPQAISTLKAKRERSGKYRNQSILPILKALYNRLRNLEQHAQ